MRIEILDLGINNLSSLVRALSEYDKNVKIEVAESINSTIERPGLIVLPGVGNFGAAVTEINKRRFSEHIFEERENGTRLLGICLGMQLLLNASQESIDSKGLGLIPGKVRRLDTTNARVPNVGWNEIEVLPNRFTKLEGYNQTNFYFTHSYYADVLEEHVLATSLHGRTHFPAIIEKK